MAQAFSLHLVWECVQRNVRINEEANVCGVKASSGLLQTSDGTIFPSLIESRSRVAAWMLYNHLNIKKSNKIYALTNGHIYT